ncbi:hypothetical protein PSTT_06988 [Puccinia striiformis]|uniref:Uncharacterized protein n=1 Tax=Puccinia striiformis TaxID=27350 RepID=A0A2S4VI38_9BASI|nr:hypothetical protein PSTT_06988 [Puccinia striiformis]
MFQDGEYASCDFFIETVLDGPKKHSSKVLPSLFWVNVSRSFTCRRHNAPVQHPRENSIKSVLRITPSMFEQNGISPSDAHQLVTLWASAGLHGVSGLQCRQCTVNSKKQGGRKAHPIKDIDAKLDEVSIISPPESNHRYISISTLIWEPSSPTHDRHAFMAEMDWPFKLTVFGSVYTLHNAGHARLVDTVPGSISGAQEHTSWLVYSRTWDAEEEQFVDESIARIRKDNPEFPSRIPFIHMKNLLNSSYHSNLPHGSSVLEPSVCDSKLPPIQEDLGPKDDAPYAEADPPAEAKSDVVKESSNCLQPPLKIRIRRPPTTVANIHPPVSVPPPTRSNPLNAEVEPADLPALEAKRGRPKKRPEIKTTNPGVTKLPGIHISTANASAKSISRVEAWRSFHGRQIKNQRGSDFGTKEGSNLRTKEGSSLGYKEGSNCAKKKATTAAKKKGSTSAPKTPATLASTAPTTFEPAPLTDTDYDWMAARGAAYWAEHWAKEDFKKATPEPSQITVAKEIAARRSARTRRSDA